MSESPAKTTKLSISEAHAVAPKCAEFVTSMRQAFGAENVLVLYVEENGKTLVDKRTTG
jgi:hypothetical protein